jgi:hypothetical protein
MAEPPKPSSFFGYILIDGASVADGTAIKAVVNGLEFTTSAYTFDGSSAYTFDVPGDDTSTAAIVEGGAENNPIVFTIGTIQADQAGTWHSGTNVMLDLSDHVNHAPVSNAQSVIVAKNTAKNIILTGSDVDGDPLTYAIGTGPTTGGLSGTPPNVTYTPNSSYTGPDSFTFTVNDTHVSSSPATISITVAEGSVYNLSLLMGWNLVSFPLHPTSTGIEDVLFSVAGNYDLVYAWDASGGHSGAGNWMRYAPGIPGNSLSTLAETQGFWIRMTGEDTLELTGSVPTTTNISLSTNASGWNLVGYPSDENRSMPEALETHGVTDYGLLYAYHANETDTWKRYAPGVPGNDLLTVAPGWGYWIKIAATSTWDVTYLEP